MLVTPYAYEPIQQVCELTITSRSMSRMIGYVAMTEQAAIFKLYTLFVDVQR